MVLFWVFLTLNSLFGLLFFEQTTGFGDNVETLVLLILNFFVSNLLAYLCVLKSSLKIVNVILGFLGLALLVFILESGLLYLLIFEILNFQGIVPSIIFIISLILIIAYGGLRQILIKMINSFSTT